MLATVQHLRRHGDKGLEHLQRRVGGPNGQSSSCGECPLLEAVDEILAERSDAVIVLFSDHGGRHAVPGDEVHHSFLAARTPGNSRLFDAEPHPHARAC